MLDRKEPPFTLLLDTFELRLRGDPEGQSQVP